MKKALTFKFDNNKEKNFENMLKWWNYVRWLSTISFLSVGIIQISLSGTSFPIYAFILTLLAITLLNIAYSLWIDNFKYNSFFPLVHNFMDIIIFSMAIFMTGGIKSPFLWGYLIPILTSSITIGRKSGFAAAALSIVGLITVSYMTEYYVAGSFHISSQIPHVDKLDAKTLLSFACLFFLVYFISSFLANTLRDQNLNLRVLNQQLNEKNTMILESQEELIEMKQRDTIYKTALTLQHEINNPLSILLLNTEMMAMESSKVETERVQKITDAVQRIKTILDKIKFLHAQTIKTRDALHGLEIIDLNKTELVTIE